MKKVLPLPLVARKLSYLVEVLYFITTFILSTKPLRDFDIWFHVKSGEIIAKLGIIHYDVFSYNTAGREWFPYEWLFQITVYFLQQTFGFDSLRFIVSICVSIQQILLYVGLRRYFTTNRVTTLFLCFFFFVSTFEFYSARPHIVAYTLLLATVLLIFEYYFCDKWKWLLLTIPITYLLGNMHGSVFLVHALLLGYAFVCAVHFFLHDGYKYVQKMKVLIIFAVATFVVSILPPLFITQYRLLWLFWQNRNLISEFIDEWTPLRDNPFSFAFVTITIGITTVFFILAIVKTKKWKQALWLIPLLTFIPLAYEASRNVYLVYFPITFMLGFAVVHFWTKKKLFYGIFSLVACILFVSHLYILMLKEQEPALYYPIHAVEFLKKYHIYGNMFNEYGYGGYILYQLYPEYKVFIDGRTDLYLTREMPDVLQLAVQKYQTDASYKRLLDSLWSKYDISFVMLRTEKHIIMRKIFDILSNDPQWSLVYWDDYTQIFVRRDGKNNTILNEFATKAATPYERDPYRTGMQDVALTEYEKMATISNSSKSRNEIGYILLQKGDIPDAAKQFQEAIAQYPLDESPFMNLAEIAAHSGDLNSAIALYKKAQTLAPDRGLIYIRLGQLLLQRDNNLQEAQQVWQDGVKNTVDTSAKKQLQNLLNSQ